MKYYKHDTAIIDDGAIIGSGTKIWHFSHVCKGAKIGENCVLGQNVFIAPNVSIGNGVKIQNGVSVYEGVTIEDDAFLGPHCVFTNDILPRSFGEWSKSFTLIKKGASIGANATIICGTILGEYCMVGAGSVVTKDVPRLSLVMGNPAKIRKYFKDKYPYKT